MGELTNGEVCTAISSLDYIESPGEQRKASAWYLTQGKAAVVATLQRCYHMNRERRVAKCGANWVAFRHKETPGRVRWLRTYCHDRLCITCMQRRAYLIRRNIEEALDGKPLRLVTLTLKQKARPLRETLIRLQTCFRKLRAKHIWKERVAGGAAFIETKLSADTGCWHTHMHILTEGRYIDQAALAKAWLTVTGDSNIVDIRMIRDFKVAVRYVTKYVSKGAIDFQKLPPEKQDEMVRDFHHAKLLITFGTWRKLRLTAKPKLIGFSYWGTLRWIQHLADTGSEVAAIALHALYMHTHTKPGTLDMIEVLCGEGDEYITTDKEPVFDGDDSTYEREPRLWIIGAPRERR